MTDIPQSNQPITGLEQIQDILLQVVQQQAVNTQTIANLAQQQVVNTHAISTNTQAIADLIKKIDQISLKIDDFVNMSSLEIDVFKARNEILDGVVLRLEENQKSTDAAVERLEAILAKLIGQNGN